MLLSRKGRSILLKQPASILLLRKTTTGVLVKGPADKIVASRTKVMINHNIGEHAYFCMASTCTAGIKYSKRRRGTACNILTQHVEVYNEK